MCGILGSVNIPLDREVLGKIAHRGPDGDGLQGIVVGSHHVVLGHRRLAIIELSAAGHQPMVSANGRHWLTYNGEIYNHEELRRSSGHARFRGRSDTESLLEALAVRGVEVLRDLNGIFAFAWLNADARKLYLARDPFGVKPLYYFASPDRMAFASELRPLVGLTSTAVDRVSLGTLLRLRFSPSPDTLFRGIRKLRPGCFLEVDLSADKIVTREVRYAGTVQGPQRSIPTYKEAVIEYERLFDQAVDRQLMADVEIGVLLSGGVDSALVAAAAQRRSGQPVKAFTIGFEGAGTEGVDEVAEAARTASYVGMEHRAVRMAFPAFMESLRECLRIVEEPLATTSIVPMHYLAKLASQEVKVVLSGQGADELLGGYTRYQGELYRNVIPPWLASGAGWIVRQAGIRSEQLTRACRAMAAPTELSHFLRTYEVFSEADVARLIGSDSQDDAEQRLTEAADLLGINSLATSVERMMSLDLRFGLADDLLLYTDKLTMGVSMECRVPLLDHDLVRYVEALPAEYRVTRWSRKRIHKDYASTILPAEIINRRKKGFLTPTRQWFQDNSALNALLLDRQSRFATYFDLGQVGAVIRQHRAGFNRERQIFLLLCLHVFLEEFG